VTHNTAYRRHYVGAEVRHHSAKVLLRHWTRDAPTMKHSLDVALKTNPFPEVAMGENVVRVGKQFVGKLDQLALMYMPVTSTLAKPAFTDADALALRDEIIADHHPALVFYLLFDLGRGDHLYDQVSMLRGQLPDRCPTKNRGTSVCRVSFVFAQAIAKRDSAGNLSSRTLSIL
jgi:hypothetical protein